MIGVVKSLGWVNRFGEVKIFNLLIYFFFTQFLFFPNPRPESFVFLGLVLLGKVSQDWMERKDKRGLWGEMEKLQEQNNLLLSFFEKEVKGKLSDLERDYTETKRAVALLNNKAVIEKMQGFTGLRKSGGS